MRAWTGVRLVADAYRVSADGAEEKPARAEQDAVWYDAFNPDAPALLPFAP